MIHVFTFSEAGGHSINEDAFVANLHPADSESWIVCLADGQGGRSGGARAAELAVQTAETTALGNDVSRLQDSAIWQTILGTADASVAGDGGAGFTTLVGLCVTGHRVAGASCGDSAAYVMCGSGQTRELTARQFKNPPVGSGTADFIPFEMPLTLPWQVLVVSDGVWKYAGWSRIIAAARRCTGPALIEQLQQAARLPGTGTFPDDFTVVLLEGTA